MQLFTAFQVIINKYIIISEYLNIFRMRGLFENVFSRGRHLLENRNYLLNSIRKKHDASRPVTSHKVNNLERRFLVWTGKYKTVAEVPDFVA